MLETHFISSISFGTGKLVELKLVFLLPRKTWLQALRSSLDIISVLSDRLPPSVSKIIFTKILANKFHIRYYYLGLTQQSSVAQWQSGRLLIDWS